MPLSTGEKLGPYEILAPIGAGGMGEVYRARDSKLKRDVALKVLPDAFAADPDRMARFQREAEVLASLNHPNIAHIYGVEDRAIVMELVEGRTLQGPLPLEAALLYAKQIAEALEYAHERGVIHRDLKPANVKVTPEETVKLLDFGLAKAVEDPAIAGDDPSNSPTLTLGATRVGMILGTAAYMSPEQAAGKTADRRADIWSFGAVLFEMLSGKQAFRGENASDTLATVMKLDPDWSALPKDTPASIVKLLRRCLTKDRKQRLQAIGEARIALEGPGGEPEVTPPAASRSWFGVVATVAAALALSLVGVSWIAWRATRPVARPWVRLDVDLGANVSLPTRGYIGHTVLISPQGDRLAYISGSEPKLFVRRLAQPTATELAGTEGASDPFFSPDGQWLGFGAGDGTKRKISVDGGAAVPFPDILGFVGATWSEDGDVIFGGPLGLLRVPSAGGSPSTLMARGEKELVAGYPSMLPGGKAVLFTSLRALDPDTGSVEVVSLADHRRRVLEKGTNPLFVSSGHLIYTNRNVLFAVPFDPDKLEIRGTPVPVLDDIEPDDVGFGEVSVSQNGTLVYRRVNGTAAGASTIDWLDATGRKQPLLATPGAYSNPRFSPDGKLLAYVVRERSGQGVWVYDLQRATNNRLSTTGGNIMSLAWSTDSRYVLFGGAGTALTAVRSDGSGQPQALFQDPRFPAPMPSSFTPDGKKLVFSDFIDAQIWTVPVQEQGGQLKAGQVEQLFKTSSRDQSPAVAPGGRWLAYQSSSAGKTEIYMRAFSGVGDQVSISNNGGTQPVWSPNGRDLLYQSGDQIMAVSYSDKGDQFVAEKPRLWLAKLEGATGWDLHPDGKRVAVITPASTSGTEHEIAMWQNFSDYLRQRVPGK